MAIKNDVAAGGRGSDSRTFLVAVALAEQSSAATFGGPDADRHSYMY